MKINKQQIEISMAKNNFNNTELIKKAGISSRTFYNIMQNPKYVKPLIVGKLAKALNVEVEYLIEQEA